ncbi:DUF202 domain-containing protein [Corynebacterium capitovis]|uniref:DUF202 domain-containing protein n=1 Tax=Corynebacterium capitovis TaxID=131081 RepID=UPI00058DCC85|nr:DUF202 domain-containing protein [Corynebacterium capitovis]
MSSPPPIPIPDTGLQPERTALSWQRTALAMMVCSVTLLRWAREAPGFIAVGAFMLACLGLGIMLTVRRSYRARAHGLSRDHTPPNLAGVTITTAMLCLLGGMELFLVLINA